MRKSVCFVMVLLLCLSLLTCFLPVTAFATTTVNSVAVTGVTAPQTGKKPISSATANTNGTKFYSLDWLDQTADRFLESGDTFIQGHVYQVQIWVEARDGYEFRHTDSKTPNVTATVNGNAATVSKAFEYNAWAMVVINYTFPACSDNTIQALEIKLAGISKVGNVLQVEENSLIPFQIQSSSAPIALYPELNINRYYPEGFRWSDLSSNSLYYNGDRFKGGKDYYVHIAIRPSGGSFTDNLVVTVNGKQATLKAKAAGYAEIGVEVTCYGSITGPDIRPVVVLPKEGNMPDMSATYVYPQCKNIDYAGGNRWYDVESGKELSASDKFVGGKQYRLEIYCMAAYPYKFARDKNNKMATAPQITGLDVDSYSFGYDDYRGREVIYLTKTFTAITPDHTCTEGPWQSTDTGHKQYCTICNKALAGGAHWGGEETCGKGKLCEVCGYEYTKPSGNHTPDTKKWLAQEDEYHYHKCSVCGGHTDIEDHLWSPTYLYQDETGHAWVCATCKAHSKIEKHTPGPEATDSTPQTCTACNYILQPAKNHTHDLSRVPQTPADCEHGGNIEYYFCTGCNDCFTDAEGKNKIPETMSVEVAALGHDVKDGKCSRCGQIAAVAPTDATVPETNPSAPVATQPQNGVSTPPTDENAPDVWVLIVGCCALFAAALVATVLIRKKKNH